MEWRRIRKTKFFWCVHIALFLVAAYLFSDACSYQEIGESLDYWRIEQEDYVTQYEEELERIVRQADQMSLLPIFGKEGSFSESNIKKTRQDALLLQGIHPEILDSPFVERWLSMGLSDYLFFIWMFYFISLLQQEKREQMRPLVRLTEKGRNALFFRRVLLFIPYTVAVTLLFYTIRFGITIRYWGMFSQWNSPLQSLESYYLCTLPVSLGGYAILHIVWRILAQILITTFFYTIFLMIRQRKFAYLVSGAILLIEYVAYTKIPSSSVLGVFAWFNLFALLDPYQTIGGYQNLNFFGTAVGKMAIVLLFAAFLLVCCTVFFLFLQRIQESDDKSSKISIRFHTFVQKRRKKGYHSSAWRLEGKKLYLFQKGLVLLLLLGIIQGYRVERQMQFFSEIEQFVNAYYEEYGGVPTKEIMEQAEDEKNRLEENIQSSSTSVMRKSWLDQKRAFDGVYEELKRVWEFKQNGYDVELINPEGYERLMRLDRGAMGDLLLCTAWILLFCIGSWYQEKQDKMPDMIWLTKRGLSYVQKMKIGWTVCYSFLAFCMIFGVRIWNILNRFPITGLTASAKSLSFMQGKSGSIAGNLSAYFFLLYLGVTLIGVIGLCISYIGYRKKR